MGLKFRIKSAKDAFTLIEVTTALTIFAIGIMGIIALFPHGLKQIDRDAKELYALSFAQTVFLTSRINSSQLVDKSGSLLYKDLSCYDEALQDKDTGLAYQVAISEVSSLIKKVEVVVSGDQFERHYQELVRIS